ncbi:MAG: MXAN_2562 family outer membrane beta-barrel protein [bacterium]
MISRRLVLFALVTQLLFVETARADPFEFKTAHKPSPQWFALEFKFGPYKPDVDSEFGGSGGPYKDIFGTKLRLMSQFTFDVQFLKKHGTLGVGGTFGYFQAKGKALLESGEPSGDDTTFNIMPFILQLVYRWDYTFKKWNIPLVPYIRAGFVYAFYWITDGNGDTAHFGAQGGKAHGGVWGYQINIGLAFVLDVLEPSAAKRMDTELGINHTYLFCEFVHSGLDDFGGDRIRLGMKYSLLAGLTMEF